MINNLQEHRNPLLEQNAVSLPADILAIMEETRAGAEEELKQVGNYSRIKRTSEVVNYTVNDVIEHLEQMSPYDYGVILGQLKSANGWDGIIDDYAYIYNIFNIQMSDIDEADKKIDLIKKALSSGIDLNIPLGNGLKIPDFTQDQTDDVTVTSIDRLSIKGQLAYKINELVKIYADFSGPDILTLQYIRLIDALERTKKPEYSEYAAVLRWEGDINFRNTELDPVIQFLISNESWDILDLALMAGADPEVKDKDGKSVLEQLQKVNQLGIPKNNNLLKIQEKLQNQCYKLNEIKHISIMLARNSMDYFSIKIGESLNIDTRNDELETAFQVACKNHNYPIMNMLARAGANVCAIDTTFNTPLINAVLDGDSELVGELLSLMNNREIMRDGQNNKSALERAKEIGRTDITKLIQDKLNKVTVR